MSTRITRRMFAGSSAAVLLGIAASRSAVAQDATPEATPEGEQEAVRLLTDAATTMTELETFQFSIITTEGETTIFEGFTLDEIQGVVRRPTDFETTITVALPFATLDLTAVALDNEVWIEVPTFGESAGGWTSLGRSEGIVSLLNPDMLILQAIPFVDNAAIAGEEEIDGETVTLVTGTVDFRAIAERVTGDAGAVPTEIAEGPVGLEIAIDAENRIRQIEIAGPLLSMEPPEVVRVVRFMEFNEDVEITQPEIEEATP